MVHSHPIKGSKLDLTKKEVNTGKSHGYFQVRKTSMYNLDLHV